MFRMRIVMWTALSVVAASVAFAQPSVTVDTVSLTADSGGVVSNTYNGKAAVCTDNKAAGLGVDADFTPSFTTAGVTVGSKTGCVATSNCNAVPAGPVRDACNAANTNKYDTASLNEVDVQNESVSASASDAFGDSVGLTGTNTSKSGAMALTSATTDGLITTTVSATASEERQSRSGTRYYFYSANNCGGTESSIDDYGPWSGWAPYTSSTATNTAQYYLDIQAPILSHTIDPAPVVVPQGGSVNFNMTASGGSSASSYTMQPKATGPSNINGPTTTDSFETDTTDGIAPDAVKAASLSIPLAAPTGIYTSGAELTNTFDLCGNSWGTINSSSSPTFEVIEAPVSCTNQAVVTAPLTGTLEDGGPVGYELVDCFNTMMTTGKKPKVVSYPGTVHVGIIVKTFCGGEDDLQNAKITLEFPPNFSLECTGRSPAIHVFAGIADSPDLLDPQYENGFYFHSGSPLMEITGLIKAAGGITLEGSAVCENATGVVADLTGVDVGFGAGIIPTGWTIYARAHVRPNATRSGPLDSTFTTKAQAADFSEIVDTIPISENNPACVDGQLP